MRVTPGREAFTFHVTRFVGAWLTFVFSKLAPTTTEAAAPFAVVRRGAKNAKMNPPAAEYLKAANSTTTTSTNAFRRPYENP
jgi:hypothetical protein